MRVADYIMQRLVDIDISTIFLVNGRGNLFLCDALARNKNLDYVCTHHEQAAGFGAFGYAVANKNIGVCMVSSGCASTNAITPLLCAYQDEVPMIFISGQNHLRETIRFSKIPIRTFGQQESDIISIVSSITKYAIMVENPQDIAYHLDRAIFESLSGRKGPVWIDIPLDIQSAMIDSSELRRFIPNQVKSIESIESNINILFQLLENSSRPILLIGNSCRGLDSIYKLVENLKIPIVYEKSSVDIYGRKEILSIGAIGTLAANRAANMAIQNADLVIAIGARLDSFSIGDSKKFAREAKKVIIDIDCNELAKLSFDISCKIIGDIGHIIDTILIKNIYKAPQEWIDKCLHYKNIFPLYENFHKHNKENDKSPRIDLYELANCISGILPSNAIVVCDAGLEELIIPTSIEFGKNQICLEPFSQGCMGAALSLAYGAYVASNRPVVAIIGDGSIMMNLQELQTIKYHNFPIKIIISNNNCYAVIRKRQKELFRNRTIGNDPSDGISCPDFAKVAECFGIKYMHILDSTTLKEDLKKLILSNEAVICEIDTLENQHYIHNSFTKDLNGKIVQRGLEDQSPFLDRELFLKEMIIKPIDQ